MLLDRTRGALAGAVLVASLTMAGCWSMGPREFHDIEALMAHYDVPGVSIAIIRGDVIQLETYGVKSAVTREPVTTTTIFQAASISKMVTATAVLTAVQDGSLDLDAPINSVLTSWQVPTNHFTDREPVSLRQLLSHTAGTTVSGFRGYAAGEALPTLLQVLSGSPPANSEAVVVDKVPGGAYRYSGGGYCIIQQALVDVSGERFAGFMRTRVLEPIAMSHSTFTCPLPKVRLRDASSGHRSDGDVVDGGFHTYPEMAAASLWTTPEDLAKFAMALQDALAGESSVVLTQRSAQLMMTPIDDEYGLGVTPVRTRGERYFAHSGHNEGFVSLLIAHETERVGAVFMMNSEGNPVMSRLLEIIAKREGWPGFDKD